MKHEVEILKLIESKREGDYWDDGNDLIKEQIQRNYDRIKQDVRDIISSEIKRI